MLKYLFSTLLGYQVGHDNKCEADSRHSADLGFVFVFFLFASFIKIYQIFPTFISDGVQINLT